MAAPQQIEQLSTTAQSATVVILILFLCFYCVVVNDIIVGESLLLIRSRL